MNRTGRNLTIGCLLLALPALALASGNSLLIPSTGRCALHSLPEDLPEALRACQQAANSGDVQAEFELGNFYTEGEPSSRDLNQALHWFEQASLQGHAQAQYHLGLMFFRGEGVPANNVQAYILLKMAAVNGAEEAMDSADQVAAQMNPAELELAAQVLGQIFRDYLQQMQNNSQLFLPPPQP